MVDPSVLTVLALGAAGRMAHAPNIGLSVMDGPGRRFVVGDARHGLRVDLVDAETRLGEGPLAVALSLADDMPVQLAQLARLWRWTRGEAIAADPALMSMSSPAARWMARKILALRTIDALGEGASLRAIGDALVRANDWPGEGESTKSQARRLVAHARLMWVAGPPGLLLNNGRDGF